MKKEYPFIAILKIICLTIYSVSCCPIIQTPDPPEWSYVTYGTADAVDLGLSVKWASHNLGASLPQEYGGYYAWGGFDVDISYSWETYRLCKGTKTSLIRYCPDDSYGFNKYSDSLNVLKSEDDVAHLKWGDGWRMPTLAEFEEIIRKCKWNDTIFNGVVGYNVTAPNGNSIFFPSCGVINGIERANDGVSGGYWASTLRTSSPSEADYLYFNIGKESKRMLYSCRYNGRSVRPVHAYTIDDVSAIILDRKELALMDDENCKLQASLDVNFSDSIYSWMSDNPDVAKVNEYGLVCGVSPGVCNIIVRYLDYADTCVVSVYSTCIDMGLSVKWATRNLGANIPEEYGYFIAWGETSKKKEYTWASYKLCNGSANTLKAYCNSSSFGDDGFTDSLTVLSQNDDAVCAIMGNGWRMPTIAECQELVDNCEWTWTQLRGVNGYLVTSKTCGSSIFLPAAGYKGDAGRHHTGTSGFFWSSEIDTSEPSYAVCLRFSAANLGGSMSRECRYVGLPIRPVKK